MKIATISSKGQITIPKAIQKKMNVTYGSKVLLYPEKNILKIKPLKSTIVEQTSGSLKKYISQDKLGKSWDEIMEQTQKLAAKEIVERK